MTFREMIDRGLAGHVYVTKNHKLSNGFVDIFLYKHDTWLVKGIANDGRVMLHRGSTTVYLQAELALKFFATLEEVWKNEREGSRPAYKD